MARTLGSMIDDLSIKSIREFHLQKKIRSDKDNSDKLKENLKTLKNQKQALLKEIEHFIVLAYQGKVLLKDEKLKLYNKPEAMNRIGKISSLSRGIEALIKKNFELWKLEDEARREDVELAYIGGIKRKIDLANQQRNDLMDKIDHILERGLKKYNK